MLNNKITNKICCLVITIFFVFMFLNFSFLGSGEELKNKNEENIEFEEYIIKFREENIVMYKNRFFNNINLQLKIIKSSAIIEFYNRNIQTYKNKLISLHENAKNDISKILGINEDSEKFVKYDFFVLFNGISVKGINADQVKIIKKLPYVEDVFPNYKISATLSESVPLINADDVWNLKDSYGYNITGKGVTIAILDTGVDYTHPDLKDNYISEGSYDFINDDDDPMDDHINPNNGQVVGHGTHCAGIACGKGNESNYQYVGVAPDAKFYAFKILDNVGGGNYDTFLAGMQAAVDPNNDLDTSDHVDIISISFGTELPGSPDDPLCQLVDNAVDVGVVVVAAAGNNGTDGSGSIRSPGCAKKSICVGASYGDGVASFSSQGPVVWDGNYMVKPDILAPGVEITSTKRGGGYITLHGTSMATPHVAGAAALLLQSKPELNNSPESVKSILKNTAFDLNLDSNIQGSGRIDILNSVSPYYELFIECPSDVYEKESFEIKIYDKNENPIKAIIIFTAPFRVPQIKYGSTVSFKAPNVFLRNNIVLLGKIYIIKLSSEDKIWKKNIAIINN